MDINHKGVFNLWMALAPKEGRKFIKAGDWKAILYIQAMDIPRLMREGFYWTRDNIWEEKCFVTPNNINPGQAKLGYNITRRYFLSDLSNEPQWKGWLVVFGKSTKFERLARFRLEELSSDLVWAAFAATAPDQLVYAYVVGNTTTSFNTIYDDMPLDGWWPWPKRAVHTSGKHDDKTWIGSSLRGMIYSSWKALVG